MSMNEYDYAEALLNETTAPKALSYIACLLTRPTSAPDDIELGEFLKHFITKQGHTDVLRRVESDF